MGMLEDKKLEVFSLGSLQDALTLWRHMDSIGIDRAYVEQYVAACRDHATRYHKKPIIPLVEPANMPVCPKCYEKLKLFPIRKQNPKGYAFRLACVNNWVLDDPSILCGYEEFHTESIESFLKHLLEEKNGLSNA